MHPTGDHPEFEIFDGLRLTQPLTGCDPGAVTLRCSHGLLNFTRDNSKLKADIYFLCFCACIDMVLKPAIGLRMI